MKKPDYVLFDKDTTAIVFGNQAKAVQRMLDFGYLCRRSAPSVSCVVNPTGPRRANMKVYFGMKEILIPVFNSLDEATRLHPESDVLINFASFRSAYESSREALFIDTIRTVVIIAEGIPERYTRRLGALRKKLGKWVIGPATVGGIAPGQFKIANAGGAISNLTESKLYRSGSVGFVSKSGGMLNEMANVICQNTDGLHEGIAIGGDAYPCSTLLDHVMRFEQNPAIKMIVLLGEVGGTNEYGIVRALENKEITKPIVAWVTGTCSKVFPSEVQFGHAGAFAREDSQTADAKNMALAAAGAIVPQSFDSLGNEIQKVFLDLKTKGLILQSEEEEEPPEIPVEFNPEKMRSGSNIVSTISDDRGEELLYAGVPISKVIQDNYSVGDVVSLLWFKKKLPAHVTEFFELAIKMVADHGPCVSGAHNVIVTARAGKDLAAAVASGVLAIGPRFGGAVDDAAKFFRSGKQRKLSPVEFVNEMKDKGMNIPGIGHRIKSVKNPDMRVELLKDWANKNLPKTEYLSYALEVEKLTTLKKGNLILNVDGCIGVLFVDILSCAGGFNDEDIDNIIDIGTLNGIFLLGRTIGMIGHFLDQNRLNSALYRHPWNDVLYMLPKDEEI